MTRTFAISALLLSVLGAERASAQGIGSAPTEARGVVAKAVAAMGSKEAFAKLKFAAFKITPKTKSSLRETHTLRFEGRLMHYASRRQSGAGFDVVVGSKLGWLCDRNPKGKATFVESLKARDALEGAYERDLLFMPLLLSRFLAKRARMGTVGKTSRGNIVVRMRVDPPRRVEGRKPFTIRLSFNRGTGLLTSAMGIVPYGSDKGKKRYCSYLNYRMIRHASLPGGGLRLPTRFRDRRGKKGKERVFDVTWKLNPKLSPSLFVRPRLAPKKK